MSFLNNADALRWNPSQPNAMAAYGELEALKIKKKDEAGAQFIAGNISEKDYKQLLKTIDAEKIPAALKALKITMSPNNGGAKDIQGLIDSSHFEEALLNLESMPNSSEKDQLRTKIMDAYIASMRSKAQ